MKKKIDKLSKYVILFDFYKELLTDNQKEIFKCYYFNDLSMQEIAENRNSSKNSIHLSLNTTYDLLDSYEFKLGILRKQKHLFVVLDKLMDQEGEFQKKDFSEINSLLKDKIKEIKEIYE